MLVYLSTVRRRRPVRDGGELVKVDWTTKTVVARQPLFPSDPAITDDPNPRGNSRGGKGLLVRGDELWAGTYHTLLVFDHELNPKRRISNPLFASIHEISAAGEDTWVSATAIDGAVLVDPRGRTLKSWWPREEALLRERYGLEPGRIDLRADHRLLHLHEEASRHGSHTHLNAVCGDGARTFVLLSRQGVLVQIEPEVRVILESELLRRAHSPRLVEGGRRMVLCASFEGDVLFFDLQTGELTGRIHLADFDEVAALKDRHPDQPFNKSLFMRGLDLLGGGRLLVGIAPATILEIDAVSGRLLDMFRYSDDVGDAVHGLAHVPDPPPAAARPGRP